MKGETMWRKERLAAPTTWTTDRTRPRVLIEHHDWAISNAISNLLRDAGFDTSTCDGPDGSRRCPFVHSGTCPRAEEADLVIFGFEISDEDDRAVLASLKAHASGRPIIVEVTSTRAALYKDELEGCVLVARPMRRATHLDAIDRVMP
ncbi:MAG: hypothetical protein ACI9C1_002934 [Candidatus Aldehydirespiratoraceae bacterium]|jgi:hypothetical protein